MGNKTEIETKHRKQSIVGGFMVTLSGFFQRIVEESDSFTVNQQFLYDGKVRKEESAYYPSFQVINYIYNQSIVTKVDCFLKKTKTKHKRSIHLYGLKHKLTYVLGRQLAPCTRATYGSKLLPCCSSGTL